MCQPRPEGAAATGMPSVHLILAWTLAGCQLGCNDTVLNHNLWGVVNLEREPSLQPTKGRNNVPHMGVNPPHENTRTDGSLVAVLVNESINVTGTLRMSNKHLYVHGSTRTTDQLCRGGTLGTDKATEEDKTGHCFFSLVLRVSCEGYYMLEP